MDFGANRTLVEVIKEWAFGGTYFRDIYSGVNSIELMVYKDMERIF